MSVQPAVQLRAASATGGKVESGSTNYQYRKVLNRENADAIKVVIDIPKSKFTPGCCQNTCSCLDCGDCLVCCINKDVLRAADESTYTWVMENRMEFNRALMAPKNECCSLCCCKFEVVDSIRAYHYDDDMFNYIEVKGPKCCPPKMCVGSRGDKISLKKPIPGCPSAKYCGYPVEEFYVTLGEGNDTAQIIKTARDSARAKMD